MPLKSKIKFLRNGRSPLGRYFVKPLSSTGASNWFRNFDTGAGVIVFWVMFVSGKANNLVFKKYLYFIKLLIICAEWHTGHTGKDLCQDCKWQLCGLGNRWLWGRQINPKPYGTGIQWRNVSCPYIILHATGYWFTLTHVISVGESANNPNNLHNVNLQG